MIVNTHIHTPYSFSAYDTIEQAVAHAEEENVVALGINDFNTIDGYSDFVKLCKQYQIYPLFGIEFITISTKDQRDGLRWNDPVNPGMMYLSGKGLYFQHKFSVDSKNSLASIWKGSQDRIWGMIHKLNEYMLQSGIKYSLDYHNVRSKYARNSVRERHLAKAIYTEFTKLWSNPSELTIVFRTLFNDQLFNGDLTDAVFMQHEIRNRLFKTGKVAYVKERNDAFLKFKDAKGIILEAGGIPCYPFLLDETVGFTEYEGDIKKLTTVLYEKGIHAIEFISCRVAFDTLKRYAHHFYDLGFCVTFGTEHNTSERQSLIPSAYGGHPFDKNLERIGYEGACMIAAHQELHRQNRIGFVNAQGMKNVSLNQRTEFIRFGDSTIQKRKIL